MLPITANAQLRSDLQTVYVSELRALLKQPDAQIDLAEAKLIIDKMIDPGVDRSGTIKQLNSIVAEIKSRLPANASSRDKLEALRSYLYVSGPWNNNQPYQYDLNDPLGTNIRSKLLPVYLSTRKGNCVSMPLLFVILGQRLGIDVKAATAPLHIFVKYHDEAGQVQDFEATSNGFKQDASYQRELSISPQAMENHIYLQPLNKWETVSVMMETAMEYFGDTGKQEDRIALANLALEYHSKNVSAMLHQGNAFNRIILRDFASKYPAPNNIPEDKRPTFIALNKSRDLWYGKAEALGWQKPNPESETKYIQTINRVKAAQ